MVQDNNSWKIQFIVLLLELPIDPKLVEQILRHRPTSATLMLTSDQSSPEIDEDWIPNLPLKTTSTMKNPSLKLRRGAERNPSQRNPQPIYHHWIPRECIYFVSLLPSPNNSIHLLHILLFFFNVYLFLKDSERQSMSGRGAEREGDTESKAGSRL
uniref:Protein phosphatase 1 regulatory subunit 1A n=1 Tax=Felis catus TaxID=9685 RepID=A0ABI7Y7M2_FELCA